MEIGTIVSIIGIVLATLSTPGAILNLINLVRDFMYSRQAKIDLYKKSNGKVVYHSKRKFYYNRYIKWTETELGWKWSFDTSSPSDKPDPRNYVLNSGY